MNQQAIKQQLQNILEKVDSISELFVEPHAGFNKSENLELISKLYSSLKTHLEFESKEVHKKERRAELNQDQQAFLLPAINEAFLELKAPKNSKNELNLHDSISGCSFILNHYIRQIDV